MAHAFETIAEGGQRVYTPKLGAPDKGPVGIAQIQCRVISCNGKRNLIAKPHYKRVIPASVAATIHDLLVGVVQNGTGQSAAISGVDVAGKTGTTSDYGDAWFVGWTPQITTAVWVGFPNKLVPMTTLFDGGPVEGGTYPAEIWRAFMTQALQIYNEEQAEYGPKTKHHSTSTGTQTGGATSTTFGDTGTAAQATPAPSGGTGTTGDSSAPPAGTGTTPAAPSAPPAGGGTTPAPAAPAPTPTPPAGGGTGGGGGTGDSGASGGTGSSGGAGLGGGGGG